MAINDYPFNIASYNYNTMLTIEDLILGMTARFKYGTREVTQFGATVIYGTPNNDVLVGTDGRDYLAGYDGRDNISGGKGDDFIYPGSDGGFGSGGDGLDTLVFQMKFSEATIYTSKTNGAIQTISVIENLPLFPVIVNTYSSIERIKFSDLSIAFDILPSQNAGSLYMLYKAAFNRAPDEGGMGYWLAQVDGGKNIVTDIAAGFVKAPEFVAKYGANPSNAFYVDQLYLNVLGRPGEAGGVAYWNQELNTGARSKAEVLVQFATLPEGAALVADLIANGIPYQEWGG